MKKIDRETVARIIDAADIVDVVSDFVTLKRRGANYIGLCPFHSERTPSFSVSKAKGICKCFSCGKGGGPVNFLMELEQMSYQEALRWLARKYGIPIQEREETEEERQRESEREELFAVNDFALKHFSRNLFDTEDGRNIGLAYFTERALSEQTIRRFELGYALDKRDSLYKDALRNGFTEENLLKSGLCSATERGVVDRFRGRVIFPVHSMSGKVVAFGGRTLRTDKSVAKYVNSPESAVYSKSRELYGLFQARRAIVKEDRCYLVEGYMDVLSMSQADVENVVASSGTSLTESQVNLMHRFTENVTVIYDADPAGIKASLRGIDMLLREGMNVRVVLFPEGEDPDSYARTHSKQELSDYLHDHETDFIKFKTQVLLGDAGNDPVRRSHAIADILRSIAVIPEAITRQVYIEESARAFDMDPKMLALEVAKGVANIAEAAFNEKQRATVREKSALAEDGEPLPIKHDKTTDKNNRLEKYEREIVRYILRYGMLVISDAVGDDGSLTPVTLLDYVIYEMEKEGITMSDPVTARLFDRLKEMSAQWDSAFSAFNDEMSLEHKRLKEEGLDRIRREANSVAEIVTAEKHLDVNIAARLKELERDMRKSFFPKRLLSDADDDIRRMVTDLVNDKHQLSKVHSKYGHVAEEEERLAELVPRAIFELQDQILQIQIEQLNEKLRNVSKGSPEETELLKEFMGKMKIRSEFARFLGERIVTPRKK